MKLLRYVYIRNDYWLRQCLFNIVEIKYLFRNWSTECFFFFLHSVFGSGFCCFSLEKFAAPSVFVLRVIDVQRGHRRILRSVYSREFLYGRLLRHGGIFVFYFFQRNEDSVAMSNVLTGCGTRNVSTVLFVAQR